MRLEIWSMHTLMVCLASARDRGPIQFPNGISFSELNLYFDVCRSRVPISKTDCSAMFGDSGKEKSTKARQVVSLLARELYMMLSIRSKAFYGKWQVSKRSRDRHDGQFPGNYRKRHSIHRIQKLKSFRCETARRDGTCNAKS